MVGFIDPIRKEVISSINECRSAGIKVLMITGDHPLTAFSIAKELNLTNNYEEVTTGDLVEEYLNKTQKELSKNKKLDVPGKTISGYYGSTYRMNKKSKSSNKLKSAKMTYRTFIYERSF